MHTHTRRRLIRLFLGLLLFVSPVAALAHEGHDDAAPVPMAHDPSLVVRAVSNPSMELVLKYQSTTSPAHLEIYVSDFGTNAPISGALISLRTAAPITLATSATAVRPGIYEAHLAYPKAGDYTLVIKVDGPVAGEFALTQLPFGHTPGGRNASTKSGAKRPPFLILGLVALALLGLALWFALRRRARSSLRRAQTVALVLAAALSMGQSASAGPRYVAKESQFLLAIQTLPLKLEQLRSQVTAVGHVVPGTGAWATIAAPQSGRFETARAWAVGDRVQRGQLLGYVQVIDRLPVRAPIAGLVADVLATSGQWVQAGQPLVRVLDPAHLRVEVPLFGENLSRGLAAKTATVQLSGVPNRTFPARVRGLAPTVSTQSGDQSRPASGTAATSPIPPLLLDVTNTGGLLRPGMLVEVSLETAVSQAVLAVPQSAIVYQETGPGVFVHTAPERFELRPVAVGDRYVDRIGVSGDLKPGDRVVTQGAYSLIAAPAASAPASGGQR